MLAMLIVAVFGALAALVTKTVERHAVAHVEARAVRAEARRLGLLDAAPVLGIDDAPSGMPGPPFEHYRLAQWMGDDE